MSTELYRIKYWWNNGGVSGNETAYYESLQTFRTALLRFSLDVLKHGRGWELSQLARYWKRLWRIEGDYREPVRILAVEQMVDGEWLPVQYTFTEPTVTIEP